MSFYIAQISDSHLFASTEAKHHGANVYGNLARVLSQLANDDTLNAIVFTGDLTQDHSEQSYQHFAVLVKDANINIPVYFLAGNHDCPQLLKAHLQGQPFCADTVIESFYWRINLIQSKSETPAGYISAESVTELSTAYPSEKHQWLFTHHHPIDVGYFIDRHHLVNQDEFWLSASQVPLLKGIACGHVHRGLTLHSENTGRHCDVLTCPATSIQFDPEAPTVAALSTGPGYRVIELKDNGSYQTQLHYLPFN